MNDERSGLVPGRFALRVTLLALGLACSGCDRLRTWLSLGRDEPAPPSASLPGAMGAYDCAPGIVRCAEGRLERSLGGAVDARTLERRGCPFEVIDTCAGRCLDEDEHLEEELPELCVGDAAFRLRHPHDNPVQDASGAERSEEPPDASGPSGGARGE